ncbi:MAG: hypothetical protein BWX86_02920 [Verrucomicrobia bacterium ADurb.Bin122]|nr:MAG: hypothetical protein BWX86_02920 [Verrucomicrobia bacterium ADurb.Bin122]
MRVHLRLAPLGAGAGAIPHARIAPAARRQPAARTLEAQVLHLPLVAAHVKLLVLAQQPQVHARILVARHEPAPVRRPAQRLDAIAVGQLLLREKIVGIPDGHATETGDRDGAAAGRPLHRGDRFLRVAKRMPHLPVGAEKHELSPRGGSERRRGCVRPPREVLDPGLAERRRGDVLPGRGVPKLHLSILTAAGEQRAVGRIGEDVGAVVVAGQLMEALARLRREKRDGAGRGGRGERLPVGRPDEVDGVVVELRGPVFGQLHATGGIRSGRI